MILDKILEFGLKSRNIDLFSTFKWSNQSLIFNYKIFKKQLLFIKKLKKSYFIRYHIKDIDKSCCSLNTEIIDFDRTKEIICKEHKQTTRKSCDGLCLKDSITFIEFKSLNNFFDIEFQHKLKSNKKNLEESEIIKEKVSGFNFNKKIRDSLYIMETIIGLNHLIWMNEELEEYHKIEKNYFIVKDNYQPLINIMEQFNILAKNKNNKLSNRETMDILIEKELDNITIVLNKPKLIDCNELKKYLEETK